MLPKVGARDLDVHVRRTGITSNALPFPSRELDRIARIRDDSEPQTQIVQGDPISEPVALSLNLDTIEISQRLLDRIDANIDRAQLSRQRFRERGLPRPRQPRKNEQHRRGSDVLTHAANDTELGGGLPRPALTRDDGGRHERPAIASSPIAVTATHPAANASVRTTGIPAT